MLAQRIFAREILLRQEAAEDDRLWAAGAVLAGKEPPFQERYVQCSEVSGIGRPVERVGQRRPGRNRWMFGNREDIILSGSRSRHHRRKRRGAYTRHDTHLLQQHFVECVHLLGTVVFLGGQAVVHREHIVGRATHICCPEPPEALEQKAGSD